MRRSESISSNTPRALPFGVALVACGLFACSSKSPTPPTPPPTLKITCPSPQTVQSLDGRATTVSYGIAATAGGTPPVTVACNPASGSVFPVGQTPVTCTATDSERRTDQCTFNVVVVAPPQIAVTKFLAFGDSITNGEVAVALPSGRIRLLVVERDKAYPQRLQVLLSSRYTAQTISVRNDGVSGESVVCTMTSPMCGVVRLPGSLAIANPDVLLLLEGVNDLNSGREAAIAPTIAGLRSMIRTAIGRGTRVMVGTLLPERPGGSPPRGTAADLIVPFNSELRAMAISEGATVVDLYQAVIGTMDTSIGIDGLHPTESGYQVMAQAFFDAIKSRFEVVTPQLAGRLR